MIDAKFLEGIGITDENAVKSITETYTADIQAEQKVAAEIRKSLDEANSTIQSYKDMDVDGIKKSAEDWQKKYEQAEEARKAKEYHDNVMAFVRQQNPKNDIYAEHIQRQIIGKGLKFDNDGKLLGGDDVIKQLRTECPDAFGADPSERAAAPTSGHASQTMSGVEKAFYAMNPGLKK